MSDYPRLISNKLHSFRNFLIQMKDMRETESMKLQQILISFHFLCVRVLYYP